MELEAVTVWISALFRLKPVSQTSLRPSLAEKEAQTTVEIRLWLHQTQAVKWKLAGFKSCNSLLLKQTFCNWYSIVECVNLDSSTIERVYKTFKCVLHSRGVNSTRLYTDFFFSKYCIYADTTAFWCIKASCKHKEAEPSALITIFNASVSFLFIIQHQGISLTHRTHWLLSNKHRFIYMMLKTKIKAAWMSMTV